MSPTRRAPANPLRMRLLLLAASGLVPLVIVLAWGIDFLYDERRRTSERSVLELSRALATAVDAELRSIQDLLHQMGTSDELERADLRAFHLTARRNAQQLGWRSVVLSDGEGRILFRSNQPYDRFEQEAVDQESLDLVVKHKRPIVTSVVLSPLDQVETFAVRVPVLRAEEVVYILTAVLSTHAVNEVLQSQQIPPETVAAVYDSSFRRVSRSRPSPSIYASPSLQSVLKTGAPSGTAITTTLEGEDAYTGYTQLNEAGWYVTVGTSVIAAHRGFNALLGAIGLGLAASLALALVLAWVLARRVSDPIEQLKDAAGALGRGEPVNVPPLEITELDEVAQALRVAAMERDLATQEREEALRMAHEANRSKDQFMAMLGHELRNPLAPIANAVQLMAIKGEESTVQERRIIERQLVHVTRLVDDLLDVSRITSGRLTLNRKPVNVAHILEQVSDAIQVSLFQRSLSLKMAPEVHTAWIDGDEVRLVQVFNNLLVNAIKFTPAGGAIELRARVEGADVLVDVQDSGVGIAPEELPHVFDVFYQAPQNPDRARGGLGLGLSIVSSLVHMHGGRVTAASPGLGHGACITVRLPMCEAPTHPVQPVIAAPRDIGSGRILVVDDNEDAADTCAALLEMSGYEVRVAYTPETALETVQSWKPQVAILDIGLPGMSGYELAQELRARGYSGRLAALTGYGQAADLAASKAVGFHAHLTKPVTPTELTDLVARLMGEASLA